MRIYFWNNELTDSLSIYYTDNGQGSPEPKTESENKIHNLIVESGAKDIRLLLSDTQINDIADKRVDDIDATVAVNVDNTIVASLALSEIAYKYVISDDGYITGEYAASLSGFVADNAYCYLPYMRDEQVWGEIGTSPNIRFPEDNWFIDPDSTSIVQILTVENLTDINVTVAGDLRDKVTMTYDADNGIITMSDIPANTGATALTGAVTVKGTRTDIPSKSFENSISYIQFGESQRKLEKTLEFDKEIVPIPPSGTTGTVGWKSENVGYFSYMQGSATTDPSEVYPMVDLKNKTVTITGLSPNTDYEAKYVDVHLTGYGLDGTGSMTATFRLRQAEKGTLLSNIRLEKLNISLTADDTEAINPYTPINVANITAVAGDTCTLVDLKLEVTSSQVKATFAANNSEKERNAIIYVSGDRYNGQGRTTSSFTITQGGKAGGSSISFADSVQNVGYSATTAVNTMAATNVSGLTCELSGDLVNGKVTLNGSSVTVTFDANDEHQAKEGKVTVKGKGLSTGDDISATYTIVQAANPKPDMKLAWTDKTVEAYDTTISNPYIVNYGSDVTLAKGDDTTVDVTSFRLDEDAGEIVVNFERNTDTTTDKKAYFYLRADGTDNKTYTLPFQFTQKKATDLSPSLDFGWTSKSVAATVTTVDNTYTSANLINLTAVITGTLENANVNVGNGKITVTFGENKSSLTSKSGTVTVTGTRADGNGTFSKSFTITQGAATAISTVVAVNPTSVSSEGGTVNYTAVTNAPMAGTTANEDYIWQVGDNEGSFVDLGVTYDDATGRYTARAKSVMGQRKWASDQTWTVRFVPFYDGAFDYTCEPVEVTQEGSSPFINLTFDNDEVTSKAGTNKFSGESNIIGEWTLAGTNCTVLSSATTGTYINGTVSYNANTSSAARTVSLEAKKNVGAVEYKATATFIQNYAVPSIEFAYDSLSVSAKATETSNIYAATNVTGITATVAGTLVNASARLTSSSSGTYVTAFFDANDDESPRMGTVTLSGKDPDGNTVTKSFEIKQKAAASSGTITFGWTSKSVAASATTIANTFTADGVTGLTASVAGSLSDATATISGTTVNVNFQANTTTDVRTGTITLSGNGGKATAQFTVTQEGVKTASDPSITFLWTTKNYESDATSSVNEFTYSNLTGINVFCTGDLDNAKVTTVTGATSTEITVTFAKNKTIYKRQGTITVIGQRTDGNGAYFKSYTISQDADDINIYVTTEETPSSISYDGGVVYLTGTTNTLNYSGKYRWRVRESFGDITEISSTTSNGVVTVKAKATCPPNTTGVQRNFTVRFEPMDEIHGGLTIGNTVAFTQQAGQEVKEPSISFDWENKVVDALSTQTTNEFSSRNLAGVSATATGGAKAVINGKTILVTYPTNTATSSKNYTVTVTGTRTDGYGTFSKSFTVTQSSAAAGDVEPVWKDDSVTIAGDYTQYTLFADGTVVYNGAVYGLDGKAEISVNDIAKQYLSNGDINWGSEKWTNGDYCKAFTIADDNGDTLFKRSYFNSYGYDDEIPTSGSLMVLNAPIDGDIPFGAEIPFSVFSKSSANYTIYKGDTVAFNGTNPSKTETNHLFRADGVNVPYTIGGKEYYRSVPRCEGQYVIYYVNAFGGWDALTVKGNSKRSDTISIYRYDRKRDNATARHQTTRYMDEMTAGWELHTGWLDDEQSRRMHHLIESNLVYLYDLDKDKLIPVVMTDTKLSYLTYRNNGRKMISYTITMSDSQKRDRR